CIMQRRKKRVLLYLYFFFLENKRSPFAMAIQRFEIPKPLDLNYILETISNPNLISNALYGPPLLSANPNAILASSGALANRNNIANNSLYLSSTPFTLPRPPPILSTQTNDATVCLYYPNGQQAIVLANVFGYYIENSSGGAAGASVGGGAAA